MVSRIPLSRQHKSTQALIESARPFVDHSIEGLRTRKTLEVVYPSSVHNDRAIFSANKVPLAFHKPLDTWPLECDGDCLHCGDVIHTHPIPIAKYKIDNRFWVFGQFCSPGCALGYVREANLGCQVESWTRAMFFGVFGIHEEFRVCPPRFTLKKYGGGMTKESWKPLDFAISVEPPLSTFAMFSEACIRAKQDDAVKLAQVQLKNITRPTERTTEIAEPTSNGREPVLLKLLGKDLVSPQKNAEKPKGKRPKKESTQMLLDCV
jgi:hypothetical protein